VNASVEEALRLAIIARPECFGLKAEDVNPLLRYTLMVASGEDAGEANLAEYCFDECNGKVYTRLTELLSHDAAKLRTSKGKPAKHKQAGNGNPASNAGLSTGGKLSPKQLRYLGYLLHQKGETPDYKAIGELTTKQATLRIRDLERELGVNNEA